MADIVCSLRNDVPCNGDIGCAYELCNQAADEIERLRKVCVLQGKALGYAINEIEWLRSALSQASCDLEDWGAYVKAGIARAALDYRKMEEKA